jgi:hypothetical protein
MNRELVIMNRIELLRSRNRDNGRIIMKLERELRNIRRENS